MNFASYARRSVLLRTVDRIITRRSCKQTRECYAAAWRPTRIETRTCPWNSSTDPTLTSARFDLSSKRRIFRTCA